MKLEPERADASVPRIWKGRFGKVTTVDLNQSFLIISDRSCCVAMAVISPCRKCRQSSSFRWDCRRDDYLWQNEFAMMPANELILPSR